jgi:hypothetical protein
LNRDYFENQPIWCQRNLAAMADGARRSLAAARRNACLPVRRHGTVSPGGNPASKVEFQNTDLNSNAKYHEFSE